MIEAGKLVSAGDVKEISAELHGGTRINIQVKTGVEAACQFLRQRPEVARAEAVEGCIECLFQGAPDRRHELLAALVQAGFQVQSFAEEEADLETLYMTLTRGMGS